MEKNHGIDDNWKRRYSLARTLDLFCIATSFLVRPVATGSIVKNIPMEAFSLTADMDNNGAATGLKARIADIDISGTVASVRLELDNWTGHKFTDMFTLLKVDDKWKIMNKVFHLHA